jgi:2-polyprenyl-3-methyl-5-hydroxy-6-metoxy-1,4-benzoquinol methylase
VLFEARDRLYRSGADRYRIIECAKCRLIRLDPPPNGPPALEHASRRPLGSTVADRLERACRRFLLSDHVSFISRAIEEAGDAGPILDFSPHGGLLRGALAERGLPVFGMDGSAEAAAANRKSHGASVWARLTEAPVAPASCRAILLLQVLEHFANPLPLLEAAHSLLRPGGRLIVQAPNAASWQFLLLGESWSGLDVPRHRIDFRTSDLEALLSATGFEILRRKHFSLHDSPAGLARSLAPGLAPAVRHARGTVETAAIRLAKDLLWCGLAVAAVPFTVLEAACRAGGTVMIEARKKA